MKARNPNRIDPIIEKLRAAWKANPDMRLGQLVYVLSQRPWGVESRDVFYVEDNVLQWDEVPCMDPEWDGPYWIEDDRAAFPPLEEVYCGLELSLKTGDEHVRHTYFKDQVMYRCPGRIRMV